RINLEFSSGLAAWWADRTTDPEEVNRRTRAALKLLPIQWRAEHEPWRLQFFGQRARHWAHQLVEISSSLGQWAGRFASDVEVPGMRSCDARRTGSWTTATAPALSRIYVRARGHTGAKFRGSYVSTRRTCGG